MEDLGYDRAADADTMQRKSGNKYANCVYFYLFSFHFEGFFACMSIWFRFEFLSHP